MTSFLILSRVIDITVCLQNQIKYHALYEAFNKKNTDVIFFFFSLNVPD